VGQRERTRISEGNVMGLVAVGILLMLVSIPAIAAPGALWDMFASWQFRDPESMRPSRRNFRLSRIGSGTLFIFGAMAVVGPLWPGNLDAKAIAALVAGAIGIVLLVISSVLVVVLGRRRAAAERSTEAGPPPNEPSEPVYLLQYGATLVSVIVVFSIVFSLIGSEARRDAEVEALVHPTQSAQERKDLDNYLMQFNTLDLTAYQPAAAVPVGVALADSFTWTPVVVSKRLPHDAWDQSVPDGKADAILKKAAMVLEFDNFGCLITGLVVIETETTVSIGVEVHTAAPVAETFSAPCRANTNDPLARYLLPVRLKAPLGDRTVLRLDGSVVNRDDPDADGY
jgi:hypothetical protein